MLKSIPFAEMRRGVIREYLHAMNSVKAMLVAADKSDEIMTESDFTGCIGGLIDQPDSQLLASIKANVKTATAAAALVFMHSAYENAVFDLIKWLVIYDPESWVKFIDQKKVAFEKVRSTSLPDIRDELFTDWLKAVEKESLPKKVERALAALKPALVGELIEDFKFDLKELEKIDQLRHDVTHKPNLATPIEDIAGKLRFLHCTVLLLEKLAEQKYPGQPSGVVPVGLV